MQDRKFFLHIGDILSGRTLSDEISLQNKFSTRIPELSTGIHCDLSLQGGDENTFLLGIENLGCSCAYACDMCSKEITYTYEDIHLDTKRYRRIEEDLLKEHEYKFSGERIDLEELLVQEILLSRPVQIICKKCQKKVDKKGEDRNIEAEKSVIKRSYTQ